MTSESLNGDPVDHTTDKVDHDAHSSTTAESLHLVHEPEHEARRDGVEESMPNSASVSSTLEDVCHDFHTRIHEFLASPAATERLRAVQEQTRRSLDLIAEALQRYGFESLCISYNGGKDGLVMLVLYLCALYSHFHPVTSSTAESSTLPTSPSTDTRPAFPSALECLYILNPSPFPSLTAFVEQTSRQYHLSLSCTSMNASCDMKMAFLSYLNEHPGIRAVFMGTRKSDPASETLSFFNPTNHGWPQFMRLHPVLEWHYADIWTFLLHLKIPYCSLYDLGYTSLGGMNDTFPNPALSVLPDREEMSNADTFDYKPKYRPAYELVEDAEERKGRRKS